MSVTVGETARLACVILEGEPLTRISALQQADRDQAVHDLAQESSFAPTHRTAGPYILHLSIQDGRLILDIRDQRDQPVQAFGLSLSPFRRLIKDYALLVESHEKAVQEGMEARIQAIDMGRRGLHNEGAGLLMERLQGKVRIDLSTARRLFTLLCVMHRRS